MIIDQIISYLSDGRAFANGTVLQFYSDNKDWVELAKDVVYFCGAYTLIKYLWNRNYTRKTKEIESNLQFRNRIEEALNDYVIKENRNGIKDISVRFVHWKNYPRKIANDGFKQILHIEYHDNQILLGSWIDNTGILFEHPLWFSSSSVYADSNGIFFFAPQGGSYKGFSEHKNKRLITHIAFTNIINFDFKEIIEYEPVFYTKHHYTNYKKLDGPVYIVRERIGESYSSLELNRSKQLTKYSWIKYKFLKFKIALINLVANAI